MLSISPPMKGAGKGDYYIGLAKEDYYTKGGEPPGLWYGEGAKALGLKGEVKDAHLRHLLDGYSANGKHKLVQNAGSEDRQSGWDLTFSAPKSVSTLWAVSDQNTRKFIEAAQKKAVERALDFVQEENAFTRRGKNGLEIEPAKLTFATFEHGTSRAQDPQLHTHCLLLNLATREDGTTGTILSKPIFEQKMLAGALYRVELAYQLENSLNLNCVREKSFFKVEGVNKALEDEFSKRRKEIQTALKESGFSSAKASDIATLNTRSAKEHLPREILFEKWKDVGLEHGFGEIQVKELITQQRVKRDLEFELIDTLKTTTNKISDKESYFTKNSYLRAAAEEAQGRGLSSTQIIEGVNTYLENSNEIVFLGTKEGKEFYTTKEILELESKIIDTAISRAGDLQIVSDSSLATILTKRPNLDSEQQKALIKITKEKGATQIVTGFAGTGKSYMLEAAKDAYRKDGFSVIGAAPSGVAAQGLETSTGIKSQTIHRTLSQIESGDLILDNKTVLVVDEAGMVGTRLMSRLFEEANRSGAKLILTGDERQIQSVQAGGALRTLKYELGFSELTQIRRQREEWAKEAVKSFAHGKADVALKAYNEKGLVTVKNTPEETRDTLISNWRRVGVHDPKDNIIIATTNLDVSILNEKAQSLRYFEGQLKGDGLTHNGKTYFEGDRVLMTRNSLKFEVKNGNIGTIKDIDFQTKTIFAELDSGKLVSIPLTQYENISLGYAITAHKSQGATYENAHLFVSNHDHKEIAYVKASRAKGNAHFYMDKETAGENLSLAVKLLQKSKMKELATSFSNKLEPNNSYSQGVTLGR